ncbi:MAG: 2-hydroxyacyl-CoA dehydratase family protein [Candidatus Thermoplasmatota archaeon]|nr:2-hydroxyacyl-CoA dehydratase family protein [Candidatus Thermoplasmatota archaeon]
MKLIGKRKKGPDPAESVERTSAQRARIETLVAGRGDEIIQRTKEKISAELAKLASLKNRAKAMDYFDEMAQIDGPRAKEIEEFKAKGGKVIGTFCHFVPLEIIDASGCLPLRLGCGHHATVGVGESYLGDPNLCPLAKSMAGCAIVDDFPLYSQCDYIIAPSPCDAKLKLGEALKEIGPLLTMNVPRVKEGESIRKQWIEEIKNVRDALEKITGKKIDKKSLKRSIIKYQKAHKAWRTLLSQKRKANVIWGRDFLLVGWVSFIDDIERWTREVTKLTKELKSMASAGKLVAGKSTPRVMLAGSPVVWPNWKLPNLLEESGAIIVSDELCSGTRTFYDPVVTDEWTERAMIVAIAERYLYPCTCPCFSPNVEREDSVMREIKESRAEGVVFHVLQGCHLHTLDASRLSRPLKDKGIPVLTIRSEYQDGDIGQIKVRVEAFLEMIEAGEDSLFEDV